MLRSLVGSEMCIRDRYNRGGMIRDQGISKAGNRRVRALRIQLAGLWLRYQPDSGSGDF